MDSRVNQLLERIKNACRDEQDELVLQIVILLEMSNGGVRTHRPDVPHAYAVDLAAELEGVLRHDIAELLEKRDPMPFLQHALHYRPRDVAEEAARMVRALERLKRG